MTTSQNPTKFIFRDLSTLSRQPVLKKVASTVVGISIVKNTVEHYWVQHYGLHCIELVSCMSQVSDDSVPIELVIEVVLPTC